MDHNKLLDWIIIFVVISTFIFVQVWILISLIHHGISTGKWKRIHRGNLELLSSGSLYSVVIACAFFCVVHSVLTLFNITYGFNVEEDELCDSLLDATFVTYAFIQLLVQIFLWLRQRTFYANQMLNINYSKKIRFLSASSIFIIFIAGLIILVVFTYADNYQSGKNGCKSKPRLFESYGVVLWISVVFLLIFGQMTLLSLFVYALTRGRSQIKSLFMELACKSYCCKRTCRKQVQTSEKDFPTSETMPESSSSNNTSTPPRTSDFSRLQASSAEKIKTVLRKTLIIAALSIFFDVLAQIFNYFIAKNIRSFALVANLNTFLSLLLLVFSFTTYRKMLLSPCGCGV